MRRASLLVLLILAAGTLSPTRKTSRVALAEPYGKLSVSFEANRGQADDSVQFISRTSGLTAFFGRADLRFRSSASEVFRMRFVGANASPHMTGLEELPGKVNYFSGDDPARWRTNIPTYGKLLYREVYPGIDVVHYGKDGQLEFDFVVAPGADPSVIRLAFDQNPFVDARGDVILRSGDDEVRLRRPVIYQNVNGKKLSVEGRYKVSRREITFTLGTYDHSLPLVIDPVLSYSGYVGISGTTTTTSITVDGAGHAYLTGASSPLDSTRVTRESTDAFVMKLNAEGSAILYSTFLAGSRYDIGWAIAIDQEGNAYVTGETSSSNFPTVNPLPINGGGATDAFVTKLNASGSGIIYSSRLGGRGPSVFDGSSNDRGSGIAIDTEANAYVTGYTSSTDFPIVNAIQPSLRGRVDAFVTKLNAAGSAIVYSTYLGGAADDAASEIAVDIRGNAYVTGSTVSNNFPTANPLMGNPGIGRDAFVTKVNTTGSALLYSTYLGGSNSLSPQANSWGSGIAVDTEGNAYVTGATCSNDFPVLNPLQEYRYGDCDVGGNGFLTKLNAAGSALVFSTYLGGQYSQGTGVALDAARNIYVAGNTRGDLILANPIQPFAGFVDAFVAKFDSDGKQLAYSTHLGGSGVDIGLRIAVDAAGNAYVTGQSASSDFPTSGTLQGASSAGNSFVSKLIDSETVQPISLSIPARGQHSWKTLERVEPAVVAYGRIPSAPPRMQPKGFAIIGVRQDNILVSETALPAVSLVQSGRVYTEIGSGVRTAVAIANPNAQTANVSFFFSDSNGQNFRNGRVSISPNGQLAAFLDENPFDSGPAVRGTFTFTSDRPIAATAVRSLTNERAEFVIAAMPIAPLGIRPHRSVILPYVVNGGGWKTDLLLVNPTDARISGIVEFLGGSADNTLTYEIAPRSFTRLDGANAVATSAASVRITPVLFSTPASVFGLLSFRDRGVTISQTTLSPGRTSSSHHVLAERTPARGGADSVQTGIAIANWSASPATVNLELPSYAGRGSTFVVPPAGQIVMFLELPAPAYGPYKDVLRVTTNSRDGISVAALRCRYNERRDFLVTSMYSPDEETTTPAELFFPHVAAGAGYTTEFVLINESNVQFPSALHFFSQAGRPISLALLP